MDWIYLSPHPDDAALSCGGVIAMLTRRGDPVQVWTICSGGPPDGPLSSFAQSLHERWRTGREAFARRADEDRASCAALGAALHTFDLPDCIYRRGQVDDGPPTHLYAAEEAIFGPVHPAEAGLIDRLAGEFRRRMPDGGRVVAPLALGGHVDHRLTRAAAENLSLPLLYYADYPYVVRNPAELTAALATGMTAQPHPVDETGLEAWCASIAAHRSQISTFWPDLDAMRADMRRYRDGQNGQNLYCA
jgi:LmbE family N-acetylglucosaminyl deacetylase